jgi:hypothetical protein
VLERKWRSVLAWSSGLLVRELPEKRRRTEVSASIKWQPSAVGRHTSSSKLIFEVHHDALRQCLRALGDQLESKKGEYHEKEHCSCF